MVIYFPFFFMTEKAENDEKALPYYEGVNSKSGGIGDPSFLESAEESSYRKCWAWKLPQESRN